MIKNGVKSKVTLLFAGVLLFASAITSLLGNSAQAAGTAHVTVEASSPVQTGADFQANFYVTASGVSVYSVGFNVSLSGVTFRSYTPGASPFNGSNSVASGGSAGSTSFQIAASYGGAVAGGMGKLFVGQATLRAGSTGGTGAITISNVQALEYTTDSENPTNMAGSDQDGSVAIQAPVTPPATCPAGQVGTPPNCSTPQQPSGGNGGGTTGAGGSAANPNPDNSVAVPSGSTPELDPQADIVSESDFMDASAEDTKESSDTAADEKTTFPLKTILFAGGAVVVLAGVGVLARLIVLRRRSSKELAGHIVMPPASTPSTPSTPPQSPIQPNAGQTIYPDSNEHKQE